MLFLSIEHKWTKRSRRQVTGCWDGPVGWPFKLCRASTVACKKHKGGAQKPNMFGIPMIEWVLFMVQNVCYLNGPPSHAILPFENRTSILSGIQVFGIQMVTVCGMGDHILTWSNKYEYGESASLGPAYMIAPIKCWTCKKTKKKNFPNTFTYKLNNHHYLRCGSE